LHHFGCLFKAVHGGKSGGSKDASVMNTGETVVRSLLASALSLLVFLVACSGGMSSQTGSGGSVAYIPTGDVQHVVVIFGENVSFDHYFGTHPVAVNKSGEPHLLRRLVRQCRTA
jgi:phospholipase C